MSRADAYWYGKENPLSELVIRQGSNILLARRDSFASITSGFDELSLESNL